VAVGSAAVGVGIELGRAVGVKEGEGTGVLVGTAGVGTTTAVVGAERVLVREMAVAVGGCQTRPGGFRPLRISHNAA